MFSGVWGNHVGEGLWVRCDRGSGGASARRELEIQLECWMRRVAASVGGGW